VDALDRTEPELTGTELTETGLTETGLTETGLTETGLTETDSECMRCRRTEPMRVPGLCRACREELGARYAPRARDVDVERYEPAMHVTPNAVALKDD
jgi:hypothetical protein